MNSPSSQPSDSRPVIFGVFNARFVDPKDVASGFVLSPFLDEIVAPSNVALLGPRGSGKTTLLKMLTLPALLNWGDSARDAIASKLNSLAVYVPYNLTSNADYRAFSRRPIQPDTERVLSVALFRHSVLRALLDTWLNASNADVKQDELLAKFYLPIDDATEPELVRSLARAWDIPITKRGARTVWQEAMILDGGNVSFKRLSREGVDIFIYGLGFETRSTKIASSIGQSTRTLAIRMSGPSIHSLKKNVGFAHTRKHQVVSDQDPIEPIISELIERSRKGRKPLRIAFDVSSVNRLVLFDVLLAVSRFAQPDDQFETFYCPAAFSEPVPQFPCIEKLGPISGAFSGFDVDPSKPLCLIMGVGFDAGVSMGIISHLEPRLTYCLWGTGVSKEFDSAVKKANFDFEFAGFNTKVLSYDLKDPVGAFQLLDSIIYGLRSDFRIVVMPMGPKLFTVHTALIGVAYFGEVAIWRVQHTRSDPPDALPGAYCIRARLMTDVLAQFASREEALFAYA